MDRRDFVKGLAVAGVMPGATLAHRPDTATTFWPSGPDESDIVVEGLFAGTMRLSHLRGMQQGGVHCGAAGGPSDIASFAGLLDFFDSHENEVVLAKSVAEIKAAHSRGLISNVFCWQSAGALGAAFNAPLGSSRTTLRAFYEIGLRQIGLCYNVANTFGAGCLEPRSPLTRARREMIAVVVSTANRCHY